MAPQDREDLGLKPSVKLVFNGPFDRPTSATFRLRNNEETKIGWAVKPACQYDWRFRVEPQCGVLNPHESVFMVVTVDPFDYESDGTSINRLVLEWSDDKSIAAYLAYPADYKSFGNGIIRRHIINCCYNA